MSYQQRPADLEGWSIVALISALGLQSSVVAIPAWGMAWMGSESTASGRALVGFTFFAVSFLFIQLMALQADRLVRGSQHLTGAGVAKAARIISSFALLSGLAVVIGTYLTEADQQSEDVGATSAVARTAPRDDAGEQACADYSRLFAHVTESDLETQQAAQSEWRAIFQLGATSTNPTLASAALATSVAERDRVDRAAYEAAVSRFEGACQALGYGGHD